MQFLSSLLGESAGAIVTSVLALGIVLVLASFAISGVFHSFGLLILALWSWAA